MKQYNNSVVSLKYTGSGSEFDIERFFMEHESILRKTAVNAIKESVDADLDVAKVAEIEVEGEFADFDLPKEEWVYFLEQSKECLLDDEEYEILMLADELINSL